MLQMSFGVRQRFCCVALFRSGTRRLLAGNFGAAVTFEEGEDVAEEACIAQIIPGAPQNQAVRASA
jgi:hypothetical protein